MAANRPVLIRTGTDSQLTAHGALLEGEPAFVTDTNQLVVGDGTNNIVIGGGTTGNNEIGDISDVSLSATGDNELLQYNSTSSVWENRTLSEAGIIAADGTVGLTGNWDAGAYKIRADRFHADNDIFWTAEIDNGNSGASATIDYTTGNKQKITLTDNATLSFTAPGGACNLILKLVQDGTGSRTVTWPAAVIWPGGSAPTLTTTAGATDMISFYYDGTNYLGVDSLDFS